MKMLGRIMSVALLEEVSHWGQALRFQTPSPFSDVSPQYSSSQHCACQAAAMLPTAMAVGLNLWIHEPQIKCFLL